MSNAKIKVLRWVDNGAPAKYGAVLEGNKYVTMKKKRWSFLHYLWLRLIMPDVYYNQTTDKFEFAAQFEREL